MATTYLKLDAQHPDYDDVITQLEQEFKEDYPDNELSINLKVDGSAAWVKASADSVVDGPILLNQVSSEDTGVIHAEISEESWTGPIPRAIRPFGA